MTERSKREPLYYQIYKELKKEILDGKFAKSDTLPSEAKLTELLGVSRSTVREAIGLLERDGLVNRIHGVGTQITRSTIPISSGMERLKSFTEMLTEQGLEPGTSYRNLKWEKAAKKTAEKLKIDTGSSIAVLERVRTGDGKPLIHTVDKMSKDIIGEEFNLSKMGESLFDYLKNVRKIKLSYSRLDVRASKAGEKLADYLELDSGSPVLSVEEVYFDESHNPVLYCVNNYRTDRFYFHVISKN